MFAELVFVLVTIFLVIFIIEKYSTAILIFFCGILTYIISSLWLKTVVEYTNEEQISEQSFFSRSVVSVLSRCQYVISIIQRAYIWRKLHQQLHRFELWFGSSKNDETPSFCKKKHCGLALSLETELKTVIDKILHTYIRSWFCKWSQNTDFIREVNYAIEDVFVAMGNGISRMDKKEFLYHIIQAYLQFFRHYVNALNQVQFNQKGGTLAKCIAMKKEIAANFKMTHWALESPKTEWHYLQSFIGIIVDNYGPVELMASKLLQNVVAEVLTQNLMVPVLDLLCEPDQLNLWILKVLKSVAKEQNLPLYKFIVDHTQSPPLQVPEPEQCNGSTTRPAIVISSQISVVETDKPPSSSESSSDQVALNASNASLHKKYTPSTASVGNDSVSLNNFSLNESHSSCTTLNSNSSPNFLSVPSRAHSNVNLSAKELGDGGNLNTSNGIKRSRSADCIRQLSRPGVGLLPLNARNHSIRLSGRNNKTFVKYRNNYSPTADVEQAEEATEAEVPRLFDEIKIVGTVQQTDPGHSPYTLYCMEYWGIFHDISSTSSAPELVRQKVNVKRRFREFIALQSRLEDIPELKLFLKGIRGPSKWLATPFSNLDKKNIAERKIFLENYLLELCKQNAIVRNNVFHEFLAYGGDASIAFVKKVSDLNVPRIDKIIYRGVRGALDLFKTALPYTPTPSEAGSSKDGESEVFESADEDSGSELKFQECLMSFTRNDPAIIERAENFLRSYGLDSSSESLCQTDLSPLDCMVVGDIFPPDPRRPSAPNFGHENDIKNVQKNEHSEETGNPMTDAMVDLGVEVLQNIPGIFKTPRLVFFIKNLFGPILDVITEKVLEIVLEKEICATLLHVLHKIVWPEPKPGGGQANVSIDKGHLLNEAIREYVVEVYRIWTIVLRPLRPILSDTLELLLGSIQNKEMNKCLLFHMCDVIIHSLCSDEIKK